MKKRFICLCLCLSVLLGLLPVAQGEEITLSFQEEALTHEAGMNTVLTVCASRAPESDLLVGLTDNKQNAYTLVLPAGETQAVLTLACPATESGSKITYTLDKSAAYAVGKQASCQVTAKSGAAFSFATPVYQTYVGRDFTFKVRVANGNRLPSGTVITIRDEAGNVLETISHNPNRTAYNFTYTTDDSWRPGKTLSIWVEGRESADASALMAVGISGSKSIYGVRREDNKIAFTMDCGSGSSNLPYILDVLDEFGLKITFFVTGQFVKNNAELIREMDARGHEIGNHSWSHPSFYDLTGEQMLSQLSRTSDAVEAITGKPTVLFRPPEGNCNSKIRAIVNAAGYEVIRWTHESYDARKEASQERSLKYSTKDVVGGSIILTHIDADCTVAVLPQIFQWYKDNGFEVVTVSELLLEGNTTTDENGLQYVIE